MKRTYFIFLLLSFCFLTGCFNPDKYDPFLFPDSTTKDNIIKFTDIHEDSLKGDGISAARIVVVVSSRAAPSKRKVLFKSNLGSFVGGKGDSILVDLDANFTATAHLTSIKPGSAKVRAYIQGTEAKDQDNIIKFYRAYPNQISASVDSIAIRNSFSSEVIITATLKSHTDGFPSIDHPVEFYVTDNSTGQNVGAFTNLRNLSYTGSTGKAQIRYSAGEYKAPSLLKIMALTKDSSGNYLPEAITFINLTTK